MQTVGPDTIKKVKIQSLTSTDIPILCDLMLEFAKNHDMESHFHINPDQLKQYWAGSIKYWDALVAYSDQNMIGFAIYYPRFSSWKGPMLYIEDFYIKPEFQSVGIGGKFFDTLIDIAKRNGLLGINLQVMKWNANAIRFYKRYNMEFDEARNFGSLTF